MRNVTKRCLFYVLIVSLLPVVVSTAWAADQNAAQDVSQQNTEKIKKMISEVQAIQQTNEEMVIKATVREAIRTRRIRRSRRSAGESSASVSRICTTRRPAPNFFVLRAMLRPRQSSRCTDSRCA